MAREMGIAQFPYSEDGVVAPYTDGTIIGSNQDVPEILPPNTPNFNSGKLKGAVAPYYGNTTCIYATKVSHAVLAGDS